MKSSKFIVYVMISMLSLLSLCPATAQNNPYRFELQKDIKKHLQRYLYELGVVRDSIPPVFTLSEEEKNTDWVLVDSSYMHIQNLITRDEIANNKDLDNIGIYAFYPLYYSHIDTYVFLKFNNECEIIYSGEYGAPRAPVDLSLQIRQILNYFDRHYELDCRMLSTYIQLVCKVYDGNIYPYNGL